MISRPHIIFTVPKPPSAQQTRTNPDDTLSWIKARIQGLMATIEEQTDPTDQVTIGHDAYMIIYSVIHDVVAKHHAEKLYNYLGELLQKHCEDVRGEMLEAAANALNRNLSVVEEYAKQWKRYRALAKINAHLFSPLDRTWILRELDEQRGGRRRGRPIVYSVWDFHVIHWKQVVVIGRGPRQESESSASDSDEILAVLTRVRDGSVYAGMKDHDERVPKLLEDVTSSLSEIGLPSS